VIRVQCDRHGFPNVLLISLGRMVEIMKWKRYGEASVGLNRKVFVVREELLVVDKEE
jgi:hypothetical protein